jgi:hypothetical protein
MNLQDFATVQQIETETQNEEALAVIEFNMHKTLTVEDEVLLEHLLTIVEKYEDIHYPIGQ